MHFVLIIAVVSTIVAFIIIAFSFTEDFNSHTLLHSRNVEAVNVEDTDTVDRAGDAKLFYSLIIDNNFIDPSNNCDFCNKIVYSPGEYGKAGIAYRNENLDLKDYHRIVFFARGQQGGEVISFISLGKSDRNYPNNFNIFPYQHFAFISKNVTLENFWKRYEISLDKTKLQDITHPFGFIITAQKSGEKLVFYLKGVTFDRGIAQRPLPMLDQST
jgi:hypothetical protein